MRIRGVWRLAAACVVVSAFGVLLTGPAYAAPSSSGTDFWLGFPDAAFSGTPQFVLELTAPVAASGTVTVPGTSFSQTFSVTPGLTTYVDVPSSTEDSTNDSVQSGEGIHVVSSSNISVDTMYEDPGFSDGYLGMATPMLGTAYTVAAWAGNSACGNSEFELIGTQNGTSVTITPSTAIGAHSSGSAYSEQLNAGQTYLGQAAATEDVTGTQISSSAPVALIAGNSCGQVPVGTSYANALMEEEPPISDWGTDYYTLPYASRSGDEYEVVASESDTTVDRNGSLLVSFGSGGNATFAIATASHITSDEPILLVHLGTGYAYNSDSNGDPTMSIVPPASLYTRVQTIATPPSGFANNFLNVTIAQADLPTLTLDGSQVNASEFTMVGDSSSEVGAQITVTGGTHTLVAAGPFGVEAYGFDPTAVDAYGFPGAFGDPARAAAPAVTISAPANGATYSVGQSITASYACSAAFGTSVSSCAGPVASGHAVTMSSPGSHTFTVQATDGYGGHTSVTATYTVMTPSNVIGLLGSTPGSSGAAVIVASVPGPGVIKGTETSLVAQLARAAGARAKKPLPVIARVTVTVKSARKVKLTFRPSAKARAYLRIHHRLRVLIRLTFTPVGGKPRTTQRTLTLRLGKG